MRVYRVILHSRLYYMTLLTFIIIITSSVMMCYAFPDSVLDTVWKMSHAITHKYFIDSQCICYITENNNGAMDHMFPTKIPVFHAQLPAEDIKKSKRITPG